MMIARAAKEGWPCPGDAAIARAYRFDVFAYQSRTDSTPAETLSVSDLTPFA
jgi:hypothetical protein